MQVNHLLTRNAGQWNADRKQDLGALTRSISRDASRGDRAVIAGYNPDGNQMTYYSIGTLGNSIDFGDMFHANSSNGPVAGHGRGLYCGGGSTDTSNIVQYISIGQRGNSHDFGELAPNEPAMNSQVGLSDGNRYVLAGCGNTPAEVMFGNIMTKGNAVDWGANVNHGGRNGQQGNMCNGHRGLVTTRYPTPDAVDYLTIGIAGTATDWGECQVGGGRHSSFVGGNGHRAVQGMGRTPPESLVNTIESWSFTTGGNSVDFGEAFETTNYNAGADDGSRIVINGGGSTNSKHYINIGVSGNSVDYGEETLHTSTYGRALSG